MVCLGGHPDRSFPHNRETSCASKTHPSRPRVLAVRLRAERFGGPQTGEARKASVGGDEREQALTAPERSSRPHAILFACGMNSVRSPMAAGLLRQMFGTNLYVGSAGGQKGALDPFAVAAMEEIGIDISRYKPITFEELEDLEGLNFDLIVTLSPPAHHKALELTRKVAADVEYWPMLAPGGPEGTP